MQFSMASIEILPSRYMNRLSFSKPIIVDSIPFSQMPPSKIYGISPLESSTENNGVSLHNSI